MCKSFAATSHAKLPAMVGIIMTPLEIQESISNTLLQVPMKQNTILHPAEHEDDETCTISTCATHLSSSLSSTPDESFHNISMIRKVNIRSDFSPLPSPTSSGSSSPYESGNDDDDYYDDVSDIDEKGNNGDDTSAPCLLMAPPLLPQQKLSITDCGLAEHNVPDDVAKATKEEEKAEPCLKNNNTFRNISTTNCEITKIDTKLSASPASTTRATGLHHSILKKYNDNSSNSSQAHGNHQRHVKFESVSIRRYAMELGNHPDCSYGPPVQLSWERIDDIDQEFDVDIYEIERLPCRRQKQRHFSLNYYKRVDILLNAGYTRKEMQDSMHNVDKMKRKRTMTYALLPVYRLMETTVVKLQRRKQKQEFLNKCKHQLQQVDNNDVDYKNPEQRQPSISQPQQHIVETITI